MRTEAVARAAAFAALLVVSTQARGQVSYDLAPEKWYPLQVGNAWYYEDFNNCQLPLTFEWINKVVADTVVDGRRWARIKTVWVSRSLPCPPAYDSWWSFTPDHFLVRTLGFDEPGHSATRLDTVIRTGGRSVFTASRDYEEFPKRGEYECPVNQGFHFATVQPFYDRRLPISTNEQGNVQDSTHFSLVINNDGFVAHYMCDGYYIYKVGRAESLKGAIVDGRRWGEADLIERALPVRNEPAASQALTLSLGANPNRGRLRVRLETNVLGPFCLQMVDLTGRTVFEHRGLEAGESVFDLAGQLAPGGYVLRVTASDGRTVNHAFTLVH